MMQCVPSIRSVFRAAIVSLVLFSVPAAYAEESYYVVIVGSQSVPKRPQHTHSWATFVKAPAGPNGPIEELTVSWMPAAMVILPANLRNEPGVNLGLHETIRAMQADGQQIAMWGPYRIDQATFEGARKHKARLESGEVTYKALDSWQP